MSDHGGGHGGGGHAAAGGGGLIPAWLWIIIILGLLFFVALPTGAGIFVAVLFSGNSGSQAPQTNNNPWATYTPRYAQGTTMPGSLVELECSTPKKKYTFVSQKGAMQFRAPEGECESAWIRFPIGTQRVDTVLMSDDLDVQYVTSDGINGEKITDWIADTPTAQTHLSMPDGHHPTGLKVRKAKTASDRQLFVVIIQ